MREHADRGLALLCDLDGTVREVVGNTIGVASSMLLQHAARTLIDPSGHTKFDAFLAALDSEGSAFDWEFDVPLNGELSALRLAGIRSGDRLILVAASTRDGLNRMNDELMRMNNAQTNALRAAFKQLDRLARADARRDDSAYNELTEVNNELANLQREMARKNAELERLNKFRNQLLGMAAHDLRTPLGVILMYSEFLQEEAELNEEQHKFLSEIRAITQFMSGLVEDLLDVSEIEAGQLNLHRQEIDLNGLIQSNAALNRALAARKSIAIEFDVQPGLPLVWADPGKIEQVLNNLVGNAVKFSHADTRVMIRVQHSDDEVEVSVEDQGQGIPAADQSKLFEPFGRTSVQGTAGEESTGLGLAIVRRIVEGHGGRISVSSEEGRGSTFRFTLPLTKEGE